jgi:hypothetical protein
MIHRATQVTFLVTNGRRRRRALVVMATFLKSPRDRSGLVDIDVIAARPQ